MCPLEVSGNLSVHLEEDLKLPQSQDRYSAGLGCQGWGLEGRFKGKETWILMADSCCTAEADTIV